MNAPMHPQIQRTLAAIVVTDAVGFSKCMSQDEDKALAMINRDLQLIGELCEFFEGKILKTVGDGVLMYFVSAAQAAACAVEMQKTFIDFAKTDQKHDHFTHRVGVHLGDIFFNQTDMMGTGVNIAARLESEAKPGAICMSQVVYDVVKARLELDADYIGELALKNISEGVAAYNVWPKGMRPESIREDTTEAISPLNITPLNAAVKELSAHPNHRRIKKLLYGTHQAYWENEASILESTALKMLLESLTDRNTTLEECRHSLYQIVATLNRQEEYTQVANIIVENLQGFYTGITGGTVRKQIPENILNQVTTGELLENPMLAFYKDIAIQLERTAEPIRTKKLLYCLRYDSWENDNQRIEQMSIILLVEGMYQTIASIQELRDRLKTILHRLNRRATYAPIANAIFKECQILYPQIDKPDIGSPETDRSISISDTAGLEDATSENTRINLRKKPDKRWLARQAIAQQPLPGPMRIRSAAIS